MKSKVSTKAMAEAALRELPSVLGAFVREDVYGHPREVHLLVAPGPNPRDLSRDVRDLLQERLGVEVDQRVISIAQLSRELDPLPPEAAMPNDGNGASASTAPSRSAPAEPAPAEPGARPRVVYQGIESAAREGRVEVSVRLSFRDREYRGSMTELDGGVGRIRAAALATLRAAVAATGGKLRLDLETAATTRALGREYVLVTAIASSPALGRRPLTLIGAQPLEFDAETAAALATLQAVNRILSLLLES